MSEQLRLQKSGSVLVVDDEPESLHTLSGLLTQAGYKVQEAINAATALATIAANKPDLVLLDIDLPRMSGYNVCKQIKAVEATQNIPVIFLSALDEFIDKAAAFAVGGADYITKPFQAEEVLMRVDNQLTIYRQQQQLLHQNALLQQAETKYRSIFENAAVGIFQTTSEGRYLNANPTLASIYGYDSPQDLMACVTDVGRQIYTQPKRRDELRVYLQQYGIITDAESEVYRRDGSVIWITENIWIVRDENDRFLYYEGTVQNITDRRQMETDLRQQRLRAERLLINILPHKIAQRLKANSQTIADSFDDVTVLFADLVNFTAVSAQIPPTQLVTLLNQIFSTFDQLAEKHGLEKIKTIGDAYMVAAGLPTPRPDHARAIARMALDMQQAISDFLQPDGQPFRLRIGVNTGPVVAGVIGIRKFTYDMWGDTVNIASRMEATGEAGRIQVTLDTYKRLKHQFVFKERGTIFVRGRGEMVTYWLTGRRN